jgi:hypothetical protein
MKKLLIAGMVLLSACTNLTMQERQTLRSLKTQGITVDTPAGNWERPASPAGAALLNLLPGIGNFYLASGNGAQSEHALYGTLNLLTWPISILWGVPEGAIDAKTINERELIYYYTFDESGRLALEDKGLQINNRGLVERK